MFYYGFDNYMDIVFFEDEVCMYICVIIDYFVILL